MHVCVMCAYVCSAQPLLSLETFAGGCQVGSKFYAAYWLLILRATSAAMATTTTTIAKVL